MLFDALRRLQFQVACVFWRLMAASDACRRTMLDLTSQYWTRVFASWPSQCLEFPLFALSLYDSLLLYTALDAFW